MLKEKIARVQATLRQQSLDLLVLTNVGFHAADPLLYYISLHTPEYALLLIPKRGKPTLYAIPFEVAELQNLYPELMVRPLNERMATIIAERGQRKKVAVVTDTIPMSLSQELQKQKLHLYKFLTSAACMAIKNKAELARLSTACALTDDIFTSLVRSWRKFKTEQDAARFIFIEAAKRGVEVSFSPIIASGVHAANPHYRPQQVKIKPGFCVIDMGVRFEGYCSDMSRTIFVGQPRQTELALYKKLQTIQAAICRLVKPGIGTITLDQTCRTLLGQELNKQFVHGLGHGLGTQVHEWPAVGSNSDVILKPGMVITIEPGVYVKNKYGIRIEDDLVVTATGRHILTKSTKNLIVRS